MEGRREGGRGGREGREEGGRGREGGEGGRGGRREVEGGREGGREVGEEKRACKEGKQEDEIGGMRGTTFSPPRTCIQPPGQDMLMMHTHAS